MINIIAAVSKNGVIGVDGKIPFHYKSDLKYFKQMTTNCVVIMGSNTYRSIGKPLSNRINIVVSSCMKSCDEYIVASSFEDALVSAHQFNKDIWVIGGSRIYSQAMSVADEIHVTIVPEYIDPSNAVFFPNIDPTSFVINSIVQLNENKQTSPILFVYERGKL